ncbi:MAG TPA: hypothetical protein VH234_05025 [Candidatus Saccharimonadales bacterium]|nr:hypothetical protein [Candidatus Saccharimonadales bacterium]
MASLVHYGLLEKRKDKYGISELGKSVLLPQVDGETESAIKEAAIKPNLFNELAHQYQGQELPSLLGNILTSPQYGISPKVKDEVVEVFKATMEYAGLLRNNRVQPLDPIHDVADSMTNEQLPSERGGGEGELRNNRGFNSRNVDGGLTPLPSGISIAFPPSLGFAVITGEFGAEIKALEKKAQALLKDEDNGTGPDEEKSEREL